MKKTTKIVAIGLSLCLIVTSFASVGTDAAKKIKLNKKRVTLKVGENTKLKVKGTKAKVKWSSSKKKIAKVSKKGKVTALKEGKAVITAKVNKKKLKCKVTVEPKDVYWITPPPNVTDPTVAPGGSDATPAPTEEPINVYPDSLKINDKDYLTLEVGETYTLKTDIAPADTDKRAYEYTSLRDYVVSVDGEGVIKAEYPGMSIVTLQSKRDADIKSSIHVNVIDSSLPEASFSQKKNVPHGEVKVINFNSDYRDGGRAEARVWTPADYSADQEYDVLYCIHGGGGNMWYWTNDNGGTNDGCNADDVLDNMYAEGLIEPVIVVFVNGEIPYNSGRQYPNIPSDAVITDWGRNCFLLEYEIIYNLMPYMEENYSVAGGPENTAVCGLSMGGGQTIDIGLNNPDIFGYVGCFSASPFAGEGQTHVRSFEDAKALNDQLKYFTIMVGENDGLALNNAQTFSAACKQYELNYSFILEPGVGHDDICWDRNLYKFMKYAFR